MRIIAGVDWSDEALAAVGQIELLYRPDEVVLVHGMAQTANLQGTVELRQALLDAGRQIIERCRPLLPAETPSIRALCEAQDPASFILDSAATVKPDLIAMGTRDLSRMVKAFIGSVSHRVLLHATVPTLIVKGKARPIARVLMAVEGQEDATTSTDVADSAPLQESHRGHHPLGPRPAPQYQRPVDGGTGRLVCAK